MGYSKAKTRYIAGKSFERILTDTRTGRAVYYWTLTAAQNLQNKAEAERIFKPVKDVIKRKGGTMAGVWERQERGAWHVHFITDIYLDVNWLRPWLVERGWGPQMRGVRCQLAGRPDGEGRWVVDTSSVRRLIRYLVKYITKTLADDNGDPCSRLFFCSGDARAGSTRFSWLPELNPSTFLYYWGRNLYFALHGRQPTFQDVQYVIRLGVEDTNWLEIDPWWDHSRPPPRPT